MRRLYLHSGKAYWVLKSTPILKFQISDNLLNKDYLKAYRDWVGADHVLKDNNHYLFCETIEDVEGYD
tara:strand:+ start:3003 stop:3206 length:204 start_codon:yes stop_codon:yes gene_type:complete